MGQSPVGMIHKALVKFIYLNLFIFISSISIKAPAAVLYEGYSKVLSGGVHIGYIISRYEFDDEKKEFLSNYYLQTNALGGNITESLRARAKQDFTPISYNYSSEIGESKKTIEAQVKNSILIAKVSEGDQVQHLETPIPKDAFFSTFLSYLMLSGRLNNEEKALKVGTKFEFEAIAEEEAKVFKGLTEVQDQSKHRTVDAYKLANVFRGSSFTTLTSGRGEVLASQSVVEGIDTQLVNDPNDATQGIGLDPEKVKLVFNDIPKGLKNTLVEHNGDEPSNKFSSNSKKADKRSGIPDGKGIIIKPE